MPLYDFKCAKCLLIVGTLQPYSKSPPRCPDCGGETTRLIRASSFVLKGGGWASEGYSKGDKE